MFAKPEKIIRTLQWEIDLCSSRFRNSLNQLEKNRGLPETTKRK